MKRRRACNGNVKRQQNRNINLNADDVDDENDHYDDHNDDDDDDAGDGFVSDAELMIIASPLMTMQLQLALQPKTTHMKRAACNMQLLLLVLLLQLSRLSFRLCSIKFDKMQRPP